jgi:hypothetical protein
LSICSVIAARITSDTGRDSTLATVSKASACSPDKRIVMAFTGFIKGSMRAAIGVVKHHSIMVS